LQSMMDNLFAVTKIGFTVADLKGNILVGTGWQDICTKFHRINKQTLKNCLESDLNLSSGVKHGEFRAYKCKNGMWDIVTPVVIGGKHVGNVYSGQFFFEDEKLDRDAFAAQADRYGFNKTAYLEAFDRVPRWNRAKVSDMMEFYTKLADIISKLSYSNLKLANSLHNQKELQEKLEEKAAEVEEYATSMEELAEERAKKLKDAERLAAIGQTAGMVGHDIRNPLQAITSELYLAKDDVSSIADRKVKENLEESISLIEKNVFYINKIVADLQDFARPLSPKKETINVEDALREALAMVTIPDNVEAVLSSEKGLPLLTADSTMLKRVLTNLIQNAVQAMPKGGKLNVHATRRGNLVKITVEDTGEGIPEEARSKMFTPLFTTKSKGQGFGLAVVKRLVEVQDGNINFESEMGKGTKFNLEFPIRSA
jgi:polar amino acid transport system substrate-binding protein